MQITILGAGAMGSLIGAFLQKSGEDVLLVDPYKAHMKKISENGLELHLNNTVENIHMQAITDAAQAQPADVLIILVKGMMTKQVLEHAKTLYDEHTYLLTLQNGIGNAEILSQFASNDHILKGVMKIVSTLKGPGVIESGTMPNLPALYLGCMQETSASTAMAQKLVADFNAIQVKALYAADIDFYIWSKAVNNISVNTACAITRTTINDMLTNNYGWQILEKCVEEVVAIANAKGIELKNEDVLASIKNNTIPKFGHHLPSTAQDVKAKRLTEIDTLNGAISKFGDELGIETPVNDLITDFIKVIELNYNNQF